MWKIIENYHWDTIRQSFDWVRDMQGVPQDPIFHAEGDVEIHTRMVLEALQELDEFKTLQEQDQHILIASEV